jgi:peptidoglycan/LPS O-acetylase OafA/YrhL
MEKYKTTLHWRADIQGLRAMAVLGVVVFHTGLPLSGGFTGVDVFFVISGYVIMGVLHREMLLSGRISLINFYYKRFLRLFPALAVLLLVICLFAFFVLSPFNTLGFALGTSFSSLFMASNIYISRITGGYFSPPAEQNPFLNLWSLSVEEQFYIILPSLIVLLLPYVIRLNHEVKKFGIWIFLLVAFSAALIVQFLDVPHTESLFGFYSPITRAWEFGAGIVAYIYVAKFQTSRSQKSSNLLSVLGFLLLLASYILIEQPEFYPGILAILPVSATVILLISSESHFSRKILGNPWLVQIGDYSYSIYLWHWPFIVLGKIMFPSTHYIEILFTILSLIPAILSYKYIETRFRYKNSIYSKTKKRMVTSFVLVPALLIGSSLAYIGEVKEKNLPNLLVESRWANAGGCGDGPNLNYEKCTWGGDYESKPIYLLGDSTATMISTGVISAGNQLQRPVTIAALGSCPFLITKIKNENCSRFNHNSLKFLTKVPSSSIVLTFTDAYFWDSRFKLNDEKLRQSLSKTVQTLTAMGHEVLVVLPLHRYLGTLNNPFDCNLMELMRRDCKGLNQDVDRDYIEWLQEPTRREISAAKQKSKFEVIDLRDELCRENSCNIVEPTGQLLFADAAHISNSKSASLDSIFKEALNLTAGSP